MSHSYEISSGISISQKGKAMRTRNTTNLGDKVQGDRKGPLLDTWNDQSPTRTTTSAATTTATTSDKAQPLSRQPNERHIRGRKRRKVKSFFKRWKSYSMRHTWLNPLLICTLITSIYVAKPEDAPDAPVQYGKGVNDFAFVAFYTIFLSFCREFLMQQFLRPMAIRAGMKTRGRQARFMEQAYTAIYFFVLGPLGLYIMSRTPVWYFNTKGMYEGFPHKTHEAMFKAYYLLQASYWAQQMIVLLLMLEKPRPDFPQLVAHHIITLSLIYLSYRFHFTYMGLAVYITHDISDFFLATSKLLNYMQSVIIVPYFILFLVMWAYLRHFINLSILASLLPLPSPFPDAITDRINNAYYMASNSTTDAISIMSPLLAPLKPIASATATLFPANASLISAAQSKVAHFFQSEAPFASIGPYTLNWATEQYKCSLAQWITFGLLMSLQLVNMFWFYLILRILYRLVASSHLDDVRSEDEDDEEDLQARNEEVEEMRKRQGEIVEKGLEVAVSSM